jgi:hypothetical protein
MKSFLLILPVLTLAIFATAGCSQPKTQRAPDLSAQPAPPKEAPQPDWLSRTADGAMDVVTAPAKLLTPKPKSIKKPPERYEPADAIIVTRGGEEITEEPATQPTSQPK